MCDRTWCNLSPTPISICYMVACKSGNISVKKTYLTIWKIFYLKISFLWNLLWSLRWALFIFIIHRSVGCRLAPRRKPEVYVNQKCFYAVTLQAISSYDLKFLDCFCGYPSLVSDSRIFRNSDIYKLMTESPDSLFSPNEYILGDKAYPSTKFCVPPYVERGNFQRQHRQFNYLHAKTRQVVERSFSLLFGRGRRLKYLDVCHMDLINLTVAACCVLHSVCWTPDDLISSALQRQETNFEGLRRNSSAYEDISSRNIIFQNFISKNIIRSN